MIDFGLKPCPLCGGEARVESLTQGPAVLDAIIRCGRCGLMLDWSTAIYTVRGTAIAQGLDPIQAWNRRIEEGENG